MGLPIRNIVHGKSPVPCTEDDMTDEGQKMTKEDKMFMKKKHCDTLNFIRYLYDWPGKNEVL